MDIVYRASWSQPFLAHIRRKELPYQSKSFATKAEAEAFITGEDDSHFLSDRIRSFSEPYDWLIASQLDKFMPGLRVEHLTPALEAIYRDYRPKKVKASTVQFELAIISAPLNNGYQRIRAARCTQIGSLKLFRLDLQISTAYVLA